ncbi:hypothetical protein HGRIS_001938 [Hohenbuehelia grisea]
MDWPGDYSLPDETRVRNCLDDADWQEYSRDAPHNSFPYHSRASFELPVDSDALMFLARGSQQAGEFDVRASSEVSDKAKIDVVVSFHTFDARSRAHICQIRRERGLGLGIFTPPQPRYPSGPRENQLFFFVTVYLPSTADGSPLHIRDLSTDLPLYSHRVGHLEDHVLFKNISFHTSNMPIGIESLFAANASMHTSNSPISGSFNTSSSLTLSTSNSPIRVDVGLSNEDKKATSLNMKTSNSGIHASVSLLKESGSENSGGSYDVTGVTSNSEVVFDFPASPIDSVLHLKGKTSNGNAIATLNPAYEGAFYLKTTLFRPEVQRTGATDPSGRERRRSVEYSTYQRGLVQGRVKWAGSHAAGGSVELQTSNLPVTLKI